MEQGLSDRLSRAEHAMLEVRCDDADALRRRLFEQHRIEVPVMQHAGQTYLLTARWHGHRPQTIDAEVRLVHEPVLLDTGGGLGQSLVHPGDDLVGALQGSLQQFGLGGGAGPGLPDRLATGTVRLRRRDALHGRRPRPAPPARRPRSPTPALSAMPTSCRTRSARA